MTTTAIAPTVKVGDFFIRSWGYDQTNVDYYKVVGLTPSGKSVRIQKWSSDVERSNGSCDYVVPGGRPARGTTVDGVWNSEALAPVETKRLGGGDHPYICVGPYGDHAWQWDGTAHYQTASGWGH